VFEAFAVKALHLRKIAIDKKNSWVLLFLNSLFLMSS